MGLVKDKKNSLLLEKINPATEPSTSVSSSTSAQNSIKVDNRDDAQLWIGTFKAASTVQTAIELYRHLPQIISQAIEPHSKFAILDVLYPEVTQCTALLLGNQLTQDTAKAVSLGQALTRYTYEGYKSLAHQFSQQLDFSEQGKGQQQNPEIAKKVGQCLFRSCELLAQNQFDSLSHYLSIPSNFWHDLHTLYKAACSINIEHNDFSGIGDPANSIHTIYVKLLLINCTRPNHFSNYELKFVFNELDFWSSLAELEPGSSGGLFVVDTSSNNGPTYAEGVSPSPNNLVLDTFNLVKFLNSTLTERADHNIFSDRISRRVIKDLVRQWGEKILRQETHIKDRAKVNIACGITSALCMLSKTDSFENFLKLCGQSTEAQPTEACGRVSNDIWNNGPTNISQYQSHPSDPVIYATMQRRQAKLKLVNGLRVNTSLNGACIELVEEQAEMQPGKSIALRAKGTQRWAAGIIRWKQVTPSLSTLCGVQFPSKYCIPAAVRGFRRAQNSDRQFMQAIIFSRQKDLSEQTSLICPPLRYTKGAKIQLFTINNQYTAVLLEELETTEYLSHFKIVIY